MPSWFKFFSSSAANVKEEKTDSENLIDNEIKTELDSIASNEDLVPDGKLARAEIERVEAQDFRNVADSFNGFDDGDGDDGGDEQIGRDQESIKRPKAKSKKAAKKKRKKLKERQMQDLEGHTTSSGPFEEECGTDSNMDVITKMNQIAKELAGGFDEDADAEFDTEEQPKAKMSKKVSGDKPRRKSRSSRSRKVEALQEEEERAEIQETALLEETTLVEQQFSKGTEQSQSHHEDGGEAAVVLNAARKGVNGVGKGRKLRPAIKAAVALPDPATSNDDRMTEVQAKTLSQAAPQIEITIPEGEALPDKTKKAKKAKGRKHVQESHLQSQDDHEDDSVSASHQQDHITRSKASAAERRAQAKLTESPDILGPEATMSPKKRKRRSYAEPQVKEPTKKKSKLDKGKGRLVDGSILITVRNGSMPGPSHLGSGFVHESQARISQSAKDPSTKKEKQASMIDEFTPVNPRPSQDNDDVFESQSERQVELESVDGMNLEPRLETPQPSRRHKRRLPDGDPSESGRGKAEKKASHKPDTAKSTAHKTTRPQTQASQVLPTSSRGKATIEQVHALSNAVETYREMNCMKQYEINELIQKGASSEGAREFWKFMYEKVPNLPTRNVQSTCRRRFHNFEARGLWTPEQDEELRLAHVQFEGSWKSIGAALNRFPEDARDRYRNYIVCGDSLRKDEWSKDEEEKLGVAVRECLEAIRQSRINSIPKGSRKTLVNDEELINWQVVSKKMGHTRNRLQCSYKWKKLKDREEPASEDEAAQTPISSSWRLKPAKVESRKMTPKDQYRLLCAIRNCGAGREGKIPWRQIEEDLESSKGTGKRMTWKVCYRKLKQTILGHEVMKLQDIVSLLIESFDNGELIAMDDSESEASSKHKGKKRKKREKRKVTSKVYVSSEDDGDDDDVELDDTSTAKHKLWNRMKTQAESQSQQSEGMGMERNAKGGDDFEEIINEIRSTPRTNAAYDKGKGKRKETRREKRVIEDMSDADEEVFHNDRLPPDDYDDDEMEIDDAAANETSDVADEPSASDDEALEPSQQQDHDAASVDLDEALELSQQQDYDAESVDLDEALELSQQQDYDTASVDLDEALELSQQQYYDTESDDLDEHSTLRDGFQDTASIDLDTQEEVAEFSSARHYSPFADENEPDEPAAERSKNHTIRKGKKRVPVEEAEAIWQSFPPRTTAANGNGTTGTGTESEVSSDYDDMSDIPDVPKKKSVNGQAK